MKRTVLAIIWFAASCLHVGAGETASQAQVETVTAEALDRTGFVRTDDALALVRPDVFSTIDGSVLIHSLPVLTLLDGRRFPISSALGRMGMSAFDIFPMAFVQAVEVETTNVSARHGADASGGVVNLRSNRVYTGGEVGAFYGRSSGKYGREDFSAYITGTVGTEKFQITAGAAYHESSGTVPRFRNPPPR